MPLYKSHSIANNSTLFVWKITESFDELSVAIQLNENSIERVSKMKSELHRRAFLSIRHLLKFAGYSDFDLYYDHTGKPYLKDGNHISISHSHEFATIIISSEFVGIDIEKQREKSIKIANKFCHQSELSFLDPSNISEYIAGITILWGAKEAIFKICNIKGISFKNNISVTPFEFTNNKTIAKLNLQNISEYYDIYFDEFEGFTLVYAFKTDNF